MIAIPVILGRCPSNCMLSGVVVVATDDKQGRGRVGGVPRLRWGGESGADRGAGGGGRVRQGKAEGGDGPPQSGP
jgi:hypothetical protein